MSYSVEVDCAPAYELLVSLRAYAARKDHAALQLGPAWAEGVRARLQPELAADLEELKEPWSPEQLPLLIWQCGAVRDAEGFVSWLADQSVGELYERLAPYAPERGPRLPRDLGTGRDLYVRLLSAWDAQYFRGVDPVVLSALEADAAAKRALLAAPPDGADRAEDVVELATGGVSFEPTPDIGRVLLVPQYHQTPFNLFAICHGLALYLYPADIALSAAGEPPPRLLRLARALADESRLRILHYVGKGECNFKDIVRSSGLAQSTVHQHLVTLRAAGLLRVRFHGDTPRYGLRPNAAAEVASRLRAFLESPAEA